MNFPGNSHLAGIQVNGSEENAQDFLRNLSKLGMRSARKLALAGIEINSIELRSCELCQQLALSEFKKLN